MVKLAPPAFVVAMVAMILWIPWALLQFAVELPVTSLQYTMVSSALTVGGVLAAVAATAELAKRTRGWTRASLVVSATALGVVFVQTAGGGFLAMHFADISFERWMVVFKWLNATCWLVAWIAFGAAGWRAHRRTALAIIALALAIDHLPPVREFVIAATGQWLLFGLYVVATPIRNVIAILLAGAIAQRAHEPARDHRAAARAMKAVAFSVVALGVIQLVIAATSRMISDEVDQRMGFAIAELVGVVILALALWRLAQQQHPALPRYRVHLVALGVVYSAVMVSDSFTYVMSGSAWQWSTESMHLAWWYLAPATLALAVLVTVLARYSRHRSALKRPTVIGGALFTAGVAGWLAFRSHELAGPVCLAVAYFGLVPALIDASRELSTDRVQTTADVFA